MPRDGADFALAQLVEQRLRALEVLRPKTLDEPVIDGSEKLVGFAAAAEIAAESGEADGGAQFPELGLLLSGSFQSLPIEILCRLLIPLPQHQPALVPI